ncbi:MAG: tetratricopeptide repeat protein [Taibaiella sp.]|nr:tetratricopeptide repeat protein [Taibaiella sp.]
MAKSNKTPQVDIITPPTATPGTTGKAQDRSIYGFRVQAMILALISLIFYANTVFNGWAFDDMMVIVQNEYVHQGFAGIPKILTGDAFESFTHSQNEENNQLTGGRYRPLSMITFAIEQQLLGVDKTDRQDPAQNTPEAAKARQAKFISDMHCRHGVNVILYMLSVVVLLYFFRKIIFPAAPLAAFTAALLFTIHPLHTEVVANVKSRDEILSLLFICLTFISAFSYKDNGRKKDLYLGMLYFLLALLSKEYGVVLVVLLPMAFYWFRGQDRMRSIKLTIVYLVPLGVYLFLRFSAVKPAVEVGEGDVMNMPYLLATPIEKIASEIGVLLNYVRLLFLPHPLAADYTYNQIPYTSFSDVRVWLSLLIHGGMVAGIFYYMKTRNVLGFAFAFYLAFLALVSNVFVNIGAPMGERLIYHSSVGFAIIIAYLLAKAVERMNNTAAAKGAVGVLLTVLVVLCGFKTIDRNGDWQSNSTLFTKDVVTVPNSVIANVNAGLAYLDSSNTAAEPQRTNYIKRSINYLDKALAINPHFIVAYLNRGTAYLKLGDRERALADCDTVVKYYPVHPSLPYLASPLSNYYNAEGVRLSGENRLAEAVTAFRKATGATPGDANVMYNLGFAYLKNGQVAEGKNALQMVLRIKADHTAALQLLQQVGGVR